MLERGRRIRDVKMEKGLLLWYRNEIKNNNKVSSKSIRKKARDLSNFMGFAASKTWLKKFKLRNGIGRRD